MKIVGITGPESTGKSSLCHYLANHFNAPLAEEYARRYLAGINYPYTPDDVVEIGREQYRLIKNLTKSVSNIAFADTELLVISIWLQFKYNIVNPEVEQMLNQQPIDLYLLCDIDLPWQADPLREHPGSREQLFELYHARLTAMGAKFSVVKGKNNNRFINAINIISAL